MLEACGKKLENPMAIKFRLSLIVFTILSISGSVNNTFTSYNSHELLGPDD